MNIDTLDSASMIEQLQEVLDKISYKPGWKFSLDDGGIGRIFLNIEFVARNSCQPDNEESIVRVAHTFSVPPFDNVKTSERLFKWHVLSRIREMEKHEIHEWFRYDGARLIDPHRVQP